MNICLLNRYFDFRGTGVTRIATEVSAELERKGNKVIRVATAGDSLPAYAFQTGIAAPFRIPRRGIDVYHALATLEAMWLPKDKSIATYLDLFTTTNPDRAGAGMGYSKWKMEIGRRYFAIGSQIAARCRYLVCISEKTKQDVLEHIKPEEGKLRVIKLGISNTLKTEKRGSTRFTLGTLSQLDKRKRIDLLIQQFHSTNLDADLLIAGGGPDRVKLEGLANGDKRIKFLGRVPENELSAFYNQLDVFCFPTAIEGYGLPAVEAMACKKPVLVLQDAIVPDEIKIRCAKTDSFAMSMDDYEAVISETDYDNNMVFATEHRWERCVGEYLELYQSIKEGR